MQYAYKTLMEAYGAAASRFLFSFLDDTFGCFSLSLEQDLAKAWCVGPCIYTSSRCVAAVGLSESSSSRTRACPFGCGAITVVHIMIRATGSAASFLFAVTSALRTSKMSPIKACGTHPLTAVSGRFSFLLLFLGGSVPARRLEKDEKDADNLRVRKTGHLFCCDRDACTRPASPTARGRLRGNERGMRTCLVSMVKERNTPSLPGSCT